jgi:glucokinase
MAITPSSRTATTRTVPEINRTAILDALQRLGPLSRAQLKAETGLSPATIERLTSALLAEKLIAPGGLERSSGGRPSSLFRFAGEGRVVAAVEVTAGFVRGLLIDLEGTVVHDETLPYETPTTPDARLTGVVDIIALLQQQAVGQQKPLLGIGIAVPGVANQSTGRVSNSVELGWQDIALQSIIETRFGVPTSVENDANAIAVGEWAHGAGLGTQSLAAYVLGVGVGAGIVNNGELLHGFRSGAGEIGYFLTDRSSLARFFAEQGDLESRIDAIGTAFTPSDDRSGRSASADLVAAAAAGDPAASAAVAELFDYIALSCGALSTVLDPEIIVLGGHLQAHSDFVIEEVTSRLVGRIPFPPRFVAGTLGDTAALIGVGELITRQVRGFTFLA